MRYSEMSAEQRRIILDDPDNYPLRVAFLGKKGILSFEEVSFLRHHGVDFDVDNKQVLEILAAKEGPASAIRAEVQIEREEKREAGAAHPEGHAFARIGCLVFIAAVIFALFSPLRRIIRLIGSVANKT